MSGTLKCRFEDHSGEALSLHVCDLLLNVRMC